jgi:hypothetical protein
MSTEQSSLDPQLIEETKQQIRSLVNQIAQLSRRSDVDPQQFYGEFLPRVVSALAAIGGVIWTVQEQGRLALGYQMNLDTTNLREDQDAQIRHGLLLQNVLRSGEAILVPPQSGYEGDERAGNPTGHLLVLGPVKTDLEVVALVEVFQRPDARPATQQGYLRFLLQMCDLAADYFKSRQLRHFGDRQVLWSRLEEFTRTVHASLDPRETAYTIANEGRRLIECDRVSVAIRRGRRCQIEAVSGQDLFDKRSNTVRLLGLLATAVVASDDDIWYTGDTSDMAPQVEDAVQEYVDESHSKTVAVLPLHAPRQAEEEDDPDKRDEAREPVGALVVEQIEDSRVPDQMRHRVEVVREHSSAALANAMEHNSLFLMPLWRTLGKSRVLIKARNLPKTVSITGAILILILVACIWPADFELEGKGELQPVVCRDVFAEIDGTVDQVQVDDDYPVQKDALLVKLEKTELEREITDVRGRLLQVRDEISKLRRRYSDRYTPEEEKGQIRAEISQAENQEKNLQSQLNLYLLEEEKLVVRSPIKGTVIEWDVRKKLRDRPVQPGHKLMRVADLDQAWHLEVNMPEHRMGHIAKAQNELSRKTRELWKERLGKVSDQDLDNLIAGIDWDALAGLSEDEFEALDPEAVGRLLGPHFPDTLRRMPRKELRSFLGDADPRLPVEYILKNDPGTKRQGRVKEIGRAARVQGDEGNMVPIKVAIDYESLRKELSERGRKDGEDRDEQAALRPGTQVSSKVYCGRRSLGFVWLHDAIAFVQSKILFRFF